MISLVENIRRGNSTKLVKKEISEIKLLYTTNCFIQKELANIYNINQSEISRVLSGKRWSNFQ